MDLFALAARLTLDASGYEEGLAAAEAGFSDFAARLTEGLSTVERLGAATMEAATACQDIGDAAGGAASALLTAFLPAVSQTMDDLAQWAPVLSETGASMVRGLGGGMAEAAEAALEPARQVGDGIGAALSAPAQSARGWGEDLMANFVGGLYQGMPALRDTVSGIAQMVHSYLHFSEPDVGPLKDFSSYAPDMMALFAQGIRDNAGLVTEQIDRAFDRGPDMMALFAQGIRDNAGLVTEQIDRALEYAPGFVQAAVPVDPSPAGTAERERPINVIFELDGVQKWVYRLNKAEEQRVGMKLSTGGAY